eukprot:m.299620 g.299620  ORF g.299620 m.299620 type:complete len:190 (-) comp14191_c0_seq1:140-709(-)
MAFARRGAIAVKNYVKMLATDYRDAFVLTGKAIAEKPGVFALQLAASGSFVYACARAPSEVDYEDELLESSHHLAVLSAMTRSPQATAYIGEISKARAQKRLEYLWLGPVSLMLLRPESRSVEAFWNEPGSLMRRLSALKEDFLDIGYFGKWRFIREAMVDFDINDASAPEIPLLRLRTPPEQNHHQQQ